MKDWSDLEEKYQEMREKDPASAEDFKKKMTERFQKTVQALEEESQAEKRQLQVNVWYLRSEITKTVSPTMVSTICSSLEELMVTPCDSNVTWRSDGHFN